MLHASQKVVKRTPHAPAPSVQHVRVDHRRADVAVAEQLLDRPEVVAGLKQVRGTRVPERVAARRLREPGPEPGVTRDASAVRR